MEETKKQICALFAPTISETGQKLRPINDYTKSTQNALHAYMIQDFAKAAQTWKTTPEIASDEFSRELPTRKAYRFCVEVYYYDYRVVKNGEKYGLAF